jgi:hypothetical protein
MKCTDARAALPLLIYGDLDSEQDAALRNHLASCAVCRREQQALEGIRRLLDATPVPRVEVDLSQLHRSVGERQMRRMRRWRRSALALGAIAAVLLLAIGLRLEIRVASDQLVVRWGASPVVGQAGKPDAVDSKSQAGKTGLRDAADSKSQAGKPDLREELRVFSDLIHALKRDSDDRDERFQERLDRLQGHVRALQAQADRRWDTTEHDVAALYLLTRKGEKP